MIIFGCFGYHHLRKHSLLYFIFQGKTVEHRIPRSWQKQQFATCCRDIQPRIQDTKPSVSVSCLGDHMNSMILKYEILYLYIDWILSIVVLYMYWIVLIYTLVLLLSWFWDVLCSRYFAVHSNGLFSSAGFHFQCFRMRRRQQPSWQCEGPSSSLHDYTGRGLWSDSAWGYVDWSDLRQHRSVGSFFVLSGQDVRVVLLSCSKVSWCFAVT